MNTDKELLVLAAKAAGFENMKWTGGCLVKKYDPSKPDNETGCIGPDWNPLTDDGDALRLAVDCNIVVWEYFQYDRAMAEVRYGSATGEYWELGEDKYAATRRAIVRAAAEIGKTL